MLGALRSDPRPAFAGLASKKTDQGKLAVRRGRKAMGLQSGDCQAAASFIRGILMIDTQCRAGAGLRLVRTSASGAIAVLLALSPALVLGQVTSGTGDPPAGVPTGVVRVEEDWEIVVKDPSPATDSLQITIVFGPADPESKTHAVFELNHSTQPSYLKGGMQLQVWWGESLVDYRNQHHPSDLYVPNETITFTTATSTGNNKITMEVLNGQSQSFGAFGGESYLRAAVQLHRANLDGFDPDYSLRHSGCGWGKNRLQKLSRKSIRYYYANGSLAKEDKTESVIHQ